MPKVDIEDIIEQRLEMIQTETPGLVTQYDIEEAPMGDYGIITVLEENGESGWVEFVETPKSITRPNWC